MLVCMRTTLILADDVASELQRRRRERGARLSDEVNRLVRLGLIAEAGGGPVRERYATPVSDGGGLLVPSIDDTGKLLDEVDGPMRAE